MSTKYYDITEVEGFEGKLFVYRRTADAEVWAYRANIDGVRGYIRRTTHKKDLTLAKAEAKKQFIELVGRQKQSLSIKRQKFDEVFKLWLAEIKNRKTETRYKYVVGTYERYLKLHFGNLEMTALRQKQLDSYWTFRERFYTEGEGKNRIELNEKRINAKSISSRNIKKKPSYGTLRAEASIINEFLAWALRNEFVGREYSIRARDAQLTKAEMKVGRRETFTENEWLVLRTHLRNYRDGIGIFANDRTHRQHKKQRQMFYCYVMLLASTGLRTGEAKQIKWGDITHSYSDKNEKWHTEINIRAEITKVREKRTAIAHSERCRDWLLDWRKESEYNEDNDLVFYGWKDAKKGNDFSVTFKNFLRRVPYKGRQDGLLRTESGDARTLYSLRHLYATLRITKANVEIYALANSLGTSVKQIEKHYGHLTNEYLIGELTKNNNEGANKKRRDDLKLAADMIELLRNGKITAEQVTEELIRISKI